jgi:SAM-dependent methyltransferase
MPNQVMIAEPRLNHTATSQHRCPACLGTNSKNWGEDRSTLIYQCQDCSSLFVARPIVAINDYEDYYPYLQFFDQERANSELKIRRRQSQTKISGIRSVCSSTNPSLLDVGSGPGYFVRECVNSGIRAVGGEVNADAVKYGEEKLGVSFQDVFDADPESYDVVTFFHVLEHLEKPDLLFSAALTALKPGGIMYIHVPVGESMSDRIVWMLKRLIRGSADRRGSLYLPDHVTGFSRQGIAAFATRNGLEVIDVSFVSSFSPEYDPSFLGFESITPKIILQQLVATIYGCINFLSGGPWIKLLARKI